MRASEKGPTPRGAVRWGSHARLMGEFEEPSPVFGSKDFFWTGAIPRVVVCWRPSSRISPGPVPRIDKPWPRCW
jgi:hypothetical protein